MLPPTKGNDAVSVEGLRIQFVSYPQEAMENGPPFGALQLNPSKVKASLPVVAKSQDLLPAWKILKLKHGYSPIPVEIG